MQNPSYKINAHGLLNKKDPRNEPLEAAEVSRCTAHLKEFWVPSKSVTQGSYGLKHRVENTHGGYCTNGSLIQAAELLGLRIEPDGSGINADIYVKENRDAWKAFLKKYPHGRVRFVDDEVNHARTLPT